MKVILSWNRVIVVWSKSIHFESDQSLFFPVLLLGIPAETNIAQPQSALSGPQRPNAPIGSKIQAYTILL